MTRLYRLATITTFVTMLLIAFGGASRVTTGAIPLLDRSTDLLIPAVAMLAIAVAIGAYLLPQVQPRTRLAALLPVAIVLIQAVAGVADERAATMPLPGAAALSLSMLLLGATLAARQLLKNDLRHAAPARSMSSSLSPDRLLVIAAGAGTLAMLVLLATGGLARTAAASLSCTSWPTCQPGSLLPLDGSTPVWLSFTHRAAALVAIVAVGWLFWKTRRIAERDIRLGAQIAFSATLAQAGIGAVFVLTNGAAWVSGLHFVASALCLVALVMVLLATLRPYLTVAPAFAFASAPGGSRRETPSLGLPVLRMAANAGDETVVSNMTAATATADAIPAAESRTLAVVVREYVQLMKPGILTLLLVTTLGAMMVAAEGVPSIGLVLVTMIGGTLIAGGANVLNCYIDRDIDKQMHRTRKRGTATGTIPANNALIFGLTLTVGSFLLIGFGANWLAALLALAGNVFYVGIYTLFLKRRTPQNIVIGGAAGAFPPLVGWAAVTGNLSVAAFIMFAIIYYWTPPHFWALALLKQGEYGRASVPMLPVVAGEMETRRQVMLYTILLAAVAFLLAPFGFSWIYLVSAVILNGVFVGYAAMLLVRPSKAVARQTFFWSMWYLFLLFGAMVADRLILA
jgi:protoheme IX farnesyltransferase